MKSNKKKITMAIGMVLGVTVLAGAAFASYNTSNGYDVAKTAVKGLMKNENLATKTSNVDLSFVDRFSGTLIITGMVADVETSLRAIMDYAERTLKFTVCEITKT